ncbi:MAG: glycosyltransferase family 25 protein [Pseudomonadota bacterium]
MHFIETQLKPQSVDKSKPNETMSQIPILIINLKRRTDRLAKITEQLDRLSLSFERVPATDGMLMTEAEKAALCPNRYWFGHRYLADSQLGVYNSNLTCLRLGLERGWKRWCILEDDLELSRQFKECVDPDFALPNSVDLLKLEALARKGDRGWAIPIDRVGELSIVLSAFPRAGRGAYLVTERGAEKLLQTTSVMSAPNDETMRHFARTGVLTFELCPSVAWQYREASDIATGRAHARKSLSRQTLSARLRWKFGRWWTKASNQIVLLYRYGVRVLNMRSHDFAKLEHLAEKKSSEIPP